MALFDKLTKEDRKRLETLHGLLEFGICSPKDIYKEIDKIYAKTGVYEVMAEKYGKMSITEFFGVFAQKAKS